jgi:predicted metal-binding protein
MNAATIYVCTTCRAGDDAGVRPGARFAERLVARLASDGELAVQPVECLSVCKRPCTVALAAPGKWTYVVGDLHAETSVEDVVDAARRFAAAPDGIVPWRERPLSFRRGVVSRTPPLSVAGG